MTTIIDATPEVTLAMTDDFSITEGGAAGSYTVTLSGDAMTDASQDVTAKLVVTNVTATIGTDTDQVLADLYAAIALAANAEAGITATAVADGVELTFSDVDSFSFDISAVLDALEDGGETFNVDLTAIDSTNVVLTQGNVDQVTTIVNVTSQSSALLITNTNVEVQELEVVISSQSGSNTTGVVEPTEIQGQEGSVLTFNDPVVFAEGETYTVTIEHVSGPTIILTDLSITDDDGHLFDIYEGNAKLETGDTGQNTNPDGYIFNLTVDEFDHTVYTVSEAIGYEVLNNILSLDTETNSSDFILDFSELSLNGGQDLFGDVDAIDISGKGTGEDNTIYISAQDVLDLDTSGDPAITITGDAGDVVNLVDLDNGGSGTWTQTATGGGTTTYTYNDGMLDVATITVDDVLTTTPNTSTFDGII